MKITEDIASNIVNQILSLSRDFEFSANYEIQDDFSHLLVKIQCDANKINDKDVFYSEIRKIFEAKIPSFDGNDYCWSVILRDSNEIFDSIHPNQN